MSADSALIADAIFSLPKEVLAGHTALLEDVNLLSVLTSKVAGWFDKSTQDGLAKKVKDEADRLSTSTTDTDLALRLFAQLSRLLGAPPRQFTALRDFDDAATDIVAASLSALRKAERKFTGSSLQDLVQFTVESMFGEVGKRFDDLSTDKQTDVLNAVRDFVSHLPQEQQTQLRAKLGIDDLSDEYLRKAVVSGSLASAFAGAVSIGGFGFYMGAVSLLSTIAGVVGLTLPFAFYTSLTSAIAVAANPLFFLPAIGGGGFLLYRSQNDALRKRLAINAVVQLALAGSSLEPGVAATDNRRRAVAAWQDASDCVRQAEALHVSAQQEVDVTEHTLMDANSSQLRITEATLKANAAKDKLIALFRDEVKAAASDIAAGEWGHAAGSIGISLAAAIEAEQTTAQRGFRAGFFGGFFDRVGRAIDTATANMSVRAALDTAVDALLALEAQHVLRKPVAVASLLSAIADEDNTIRSYASERGIVDASIATIKQDLKRARKRLASRAQAVAHAKGRYWGVTS